MHLTEDDLRVIWRDLYTDAIRTGYDHKTATVHAGHFVDCLRADILPATTRTAEDERRDVVAYLVESARRRQVDDWDSASIASGRHVGAADREAVKP